MATSSSPAGEQKPPILAGLPDGVALRCLAFLPRSEHARLRCVNIRWRDLFKQDLFMHSLRRSMGLTQNYLLLVPREKPMFASPATLTCYEIQVHPLSLRKCSLRIPLRADESPTIRGHACITMGPFVLILGGIRDDQKPSSHLHIFDTVSSTWWAGANMQFARDHFAWGVIGSHLYVAGGVTNEKVCYSQRVEVYDFNANRWSRVADIPVCMLIELFFVHKGALYVHGFLGGYLDCVRKLFSYHPLENEWKDEEWMLGKVLSNLMPLTKNKITALQDKDDDTLYMLDTLGRRCSGYDDFLKVMKLAPGASEWESHFEVRDVVDMSSKCPCFPGICSDFSFPSIGKKVVVMNHLNMLLFYNDCYDYVDDDKLGVELMTSTEVLKVSLACPAHWDAVVINA